MLKNLSAIFLVLISFACYAQQTDSSAVDENEEVVFVKPDNSAPLKLGLKLGVGYSSLLGSELQNPVGRMGVNGSAYLRYRFKRKFGLQTEFGASFRGSNFSNGPGEYSSIRSYYFDMPVVLTYSYDKTGNDLAVVGIQYSYLLNSSLYLSNAALPESYAPGLFRHDLSIVIGPQFNTDFVAFQILGKFGLINMNENKAWPGNAKPLNNGGSIRNFSIELNLLF